MRKTFQRILPHRTLVYVLAHSMFCVSIASVLAADDLTTSPDAFIEFSRDPASLIVNYELHLGEMADADHGPTLSIYGDGIVDIHYPVYMSRAGDYALQLSAGEMNELLGTLVDDGVIEFDAEKARVSKQEIDTRRRNQDGTMQFVSDPSVSVFEIHLEGYAPSNGMKSVPISKTIRWSGLQSDARVYPDHTAIQNLAAVEQTLRVLMERSDLVRIELKTDMASANQDEAGSAPK